MSSPSVTSCLNILRRTAVEDTDQNTAALATLFTENDEVEDLYQRVDSPLKTASDQNMGGKKYILSDHNRDGESHRSPWSNKFYPPLPITSDVLDDTIGTFKPSPHLRQMEVTANEVFESYCGMYFGKGEEVVSSVYLWDKLGGSGGGCTESVRKSGFAGCFLISKTNEGSEEDGTGYWNSIHVVDVGPSVGGKAKYKLTNTVLLSMNVRKGDAHNSKSSINITGSLTKQMERTCQVSNKGGETVSAGHIVNIGTMIEEIETEMRSKMDALYIQKTKEVVDSIRCSTGDRRRSGLMAAMMKGEHTGFQAKHAAITASLRNSSSSDH